MEEKTAHMLRKLKESGHNVEETAQDVYRCRNCGRYAIVETIRGVWQSSGAMLRGKCAGALRKG